MALYCTTDFAGAGDFAVAVDPEPAADGDDGAGRMLAGSPAKHVHIVDANGGDLAAGVIIEPAKVVESTVGIVRDFRGGAEPLGASYWTWKPRAPVLM